MFVKPNLRPLVTWLRLWHHKWTMKHYYILLYIPSSSALKICPGAVTAAFADTYETAKKPLVIT